MLSSIEVMLRSHAELRDVEAASWIISSFLGPPPNMSLREACSTGCVRLLEWMWASSCISVADRQPQWTLTNYMRSDPHYYRYQFSKSVEIAAARGDLVVLEWLFAHFSGCEVPTSVVDAAVRKGHLPAVQFLWFNSSESRVDETPIHKKRKIVDGSGPILAEKLDRESPERGGTDNDVRWGDRLVVFAAEHDHFEIVRWLCENTLEDKGDDWDDMNGDQVIEYTLRFSDDDLVKPLLPPGRCVLDGANRNLSNGSFSTQ
ncbi:DNA excision repair protein ERCC-6 [Phytophthora pseudosyringae]|uniref:DNA excision repair protein ERCC-6 n=1 Tax=Phytophthora pseudosyringae TaxID=221518 RepID=A0A8T1VZA5_9STRA|nr:DNA excision repair protein ERCC-6 [Phytophthora pseudosyringae]